VKLAMGKKYGITTTAQEVPYHTLKKSLCKYNCYLLLLLDENWKLEMRFNDTISVSVNVILKHPKKCVTSLSSSLSS
jgi:hypothetical protein